MQKKDDIESIISTHVRQAPQKVQIRAEVELSKPGEDTEREKLRIFLNSNIVPVLQDGLSDQAFLDMIDQLVSTLSTFASYGSGWTVDSITEIKITLAKFSPIRAGSYLALPTNLSGYHMRNLFLNIRNYVLFHFIRKSIFMVIFHASKISKNSEFCDSDLAKG